MLLWSIWLGRNKCLYKKLAPNPIEASFLSRKFAAEYMDVHRKNNGIADSDVHKIAGPTHWVAPDVR